MAKYLSRLGTSKVMHCVYLKEFELELKGLSKELNVIRIDCKRGKYKKQITSDDGTKMDNKNQTLQFSETFMQISQFYVKGEKAQKKWFNIDVKGFDEKKKSYNLGKVQFDISPLVGKQNEKMSLSLSKGLIPSAKINFIIGVAIPSQIQDKAPEI